MTLQQLAKQLHIPVEKLEKETLRTFLLSKLGEIEAKRNKFLKKYKVEGVQDWDEKMQEGKRKEGGYVGIADYFLLDSLDTEKEEIIKSLLSFE